MFNHGLDRRAAGYTWTVLFILLLLSKGTKLQPVVVIFGILAGAQIAGVPGSFLAIPILAILRIIYRQLKKKLPDSLLDSPQTGIV
jgi:predicted PurR-regulated permease PerM